VPPAAAQDNGLVIQNNGVNSSDSAAGADNVQISRAPGNSSSSNGAGMNNEIATVEKAPKERNRKDRDRTAVDAAPEEAYVPPAEGEYDAYADGSEWVDPAAGEMAAAPEELSPQAVDPNLPVQLPNTGAGAGGMTPFFAIVAGIAAAGFGVLGLSRRPKN
jgi:hypothetical protein